MIRFENVVVSYDPAQPVLKEMSFHIAKGENVGLIGANGAGKSTMLKALLGLLPYQGSILVDGLPVNKEHLAEVRRKLGFVLQSSDDQMFMPTVFRDMTFGLLNYGMDAASAEKKVDMVLERMNLSYLKEKYNHRISGGEKRMAAIATVLAMEPEIMVMDEPSVSLDPYNRRCVIRTIQSLDQTKLIASHDLDMILETCSKVILIADGRIVCAGPAMEILTNKDLLENNRMELTHWGEELASKR